MTCMIINHICIIKMILVLLIMINLKYTRWSWGLSTFVKYILSISEKYTVVHESSVIVSVII